jgi:hypothetical protein
MKVERIEPGPANELMISNHYLHRKANVSFAYGLFVHGQLLGVVTFGAPASHAVQKSACRTAPKLVVELNRLWVDDIMPRNTESWFVARALNLLPGGRVVVSYADTSAGHTGYIYRALNFNYAGLTDADRKTPRFDYIVPGKHSRQAFRGGVAQYTEKVRRQPKHRYWIVTGNKRERRDTGRIVTWPSLPTNNS